MATEEASRHSIGFWIAFIRGLLLMIMGLSLLVIPDKTHNTLYNMMGLFWLTSGIVGIRQETAGQGHRLSLVAAAIGVLTGVLVVTRNLTRNWMPEGWEVVLLGAVILLTGVLHMVVGFRVGKQVLHGRTALSTLLGVLEFILGTLLLLSPTELEQFIYLAATIWALVGGALLLVNAMYQRRQKRPGRSPSGTAGQ